MRSNKLCLCILLTFIFVGYAYSKGNMEQKQTNNTMWSFYKVSKNDLFGESSLDVTQSLVTLYDQVIITLNNKVLTIDNSLLKDSRVCSVEYSKIKTPPLAYFYSQQTKELYEKLFNQENIPLSNEIYILSASNPDQECNPPYNEIIENSGYLIFIDQGRLLFFRNVQSNEKSLNEKAQFKDDFPEYCKDINEGQIFDGSSNYVCKYPNKTLLEVYLRTKNIIDDGPFMRHTLPTRNISFFIEENKVTYKWIKPNMLRLVIVKSAEVVTYIFEEKQDGTELIINVDTGY